MWAYAITAVVSLLFLAFEVIFYIFLLISTYSYSLKEDRVVLADILG